MEVKSTTSKSEFYILMQWSSLCEWLIQKYFVECYECTKAVYVTD